MADETAVDAGSGKKPHYTDALKRRAEAAEDRVRELESLLAAKTLSVGGAAVADAPAKAASGTGGLEPIPPALFLAQLIVALQTSHPEKFLPDALNGTKFGAAMAYHAYVELTTGFDKALESVKDYHRQVAEQAEAEAREQQRMLAERAATRARVRGGPVTIRSSVSQTVPDGLTPEEAKLLAASRANGAGRPMSVDAD